MLSGFKKMKDLMLRPIGVFIVVVFIAVAGLILSVYEEDINPVINFYKETNLLKVVNGETSISKISDEISLLIEGIKG